MTQHKDNIKPFHLSPAALRVGRPGPWVVWILHSLESGLRKTSGGDGSENATSARSSVSRRGRDDGGFSRGFLDCPD